MDLWIDGTDESARLAGRLVRAPSPLVMVIQCFFLLFFLNADDGGMSAPAVIEPRGDYSR